MDEDEKVIKEMEERVLGRPKSEMAEREEKILEFWKDKAIFQKTLEKESPKGEFVFYEGPPTANAAPALHHLEARAFKDIIPRYKTMQGYHVRRKGGWDTHGLPVELQIEKKLGLKSKKEIETYGIAEFNRQCRESVWEYVGLWNKFTDRIGFWVDEKNPYVTYENNYIESLWNIVSRVNKRNLLYKDYKVVPWCPRCGTALSSHELAQGYDDITDISVYVKFKLVPDQKFGENKEFVTGQSAYIVAWTTTPWTLPGNVGLAVSEKISYSAICIDGIKELLIIATDLVDSVFAGHEIERVHEFKGKGLLGLSYEPLYPYLSDLATGEAKEKLQNAFKIYPADFVTITDGTGVVHTAVMYGQEDFELGAKVGLPKFHLVTPDGTFVPGTGPFSGKYVRNEETAVDVIKDLAGRGLLFKKEKRKHSYPHCWRCKTALIYYARDSWYIRMSSLRDELQKENEKINWEPSHIKEGRFGEWISEIKDWAISRERYWGTPLPVWESQDGTPHIIGSIAELKERIKKSGNTYVVMRHAESEKNTKAVVNADPKNVFHLTEEGKKQAKESAKEMKGETFDIIISSPFARCHETAQIVKEVTGFSGDIVTDDRLWEIKSGTEYEGQPDGANLKFFKTYEERFEKAPEGGETFIELNGRVGEFLYELEEKYKGKRILIVSHAAPISFMKAVSLGANREQIFHIRSEESMFGYAHFEKLNFVPLPHDEYYEFDLHRPYVDTIELEDENGGKLTRVKEVMDVWFDSGSMPFAQDHYPFENQAWVDGKGYPADFIAEAVDQTRGWFYLLLCIGVLMDKGTPYKNVICLGHILDKDGKKMSKSVGNIVDPWKMMDTYGVDALRLWMYSVNGPGDSKNFDEKTVDEIVKKIFNPLSNIYALYILYEKDVTRIDPHTSENPLDRWILSRLAELVSEGTRYLDQYKIFEPARILRDFVADFSAWYIRRSRERMKSSDPKEVAAAISVTEHVLIETAKYMAPFTPFYADSLYREVTKETKRQSVHLENWSVPGVADENVIQTMQKVREAVTVALELRQKAGIKVRQPLGKLTITENFSGDFLDIIADEVNVKEVIVGKEFSLDTDLTPDLISEGVARDTIRVVQDIRKKLNFDPSAKAQSLTIQVSDSTRSMIEKHENVIQNRTLVLEITFSSDEQEHKVMIGDSEGTISISK